MGGTGQEWCAGPRHGFSECFQACFSLTLSKIHVYGHSSTWLSAFFKRRMLVALDDAIKLASVVALAFTPNLAMRVLALFMFRHGGGTGALG